MSAFLWTMAALFTFNCVFNVYYLGSGKVPTPTTRGARAISLVIECMLLVWVLYVLGVV